MKLELVTELNLELMIHPAIITNVGRIPPTESRCALLGLHAEGSLRDDMTSEVAVNVIGYALRTLNADALIGVPHLRNNREVNRRVDCPTAVESLCRSSCYANRELNERCGIRLVFKGLNAVQLRVICALIGINNPCSDMRDNL